ncbi:MAG: formate dehydrogenase accessory protein FdhE [Firmicutes bacterium]|nr:formate dehydrogenase accessory protein FdhE [Bacillota bacterium]
MYSILEQAALDESKKCLSLYAGANNLEAMLTVLSEAKKALVEQEGDFFRPDQFDLSPEEIRKKLRESQVLMPAAYFKDEQVQRFISYFCDELINSNRDFRKPLEFLQVSVKRALSENNGFFAQQQLPSLIERVAEETLLEKDFISFFLTFIFSLLYSAPRALFLRELDTSLWEEGFCPVCGESPHYGFLRKEEGAKFLECWLCGSSWRYPRIKCPYCNNKDQEKLGFFTVGDNEVCRVHFCRQCQKYHKVYDWRKYAEKFPETKAAAAVHHLHTLYFDWLAQKEGFLPGSGLKWVGEEVTN